MTANHTRKNTFSLRLKSVLLTAFAAMLLLTGCEKSAQAELSADGCISPFSWGMTRTAAGQELDKLEGIDVTSAEGERIKLDTVLMGCNATVELKFGELPVITQTEPVLTAVNIIFKGWDRETAMKNITGALGDAESYRQVYKNDAEGERIEPGEELSENTRFWHGKKNLIDILGEDKLVELYGLTPEALEEQSVLKRFYLSYTYTATLYDNIAGTDGDACLLSIDGLPSAVTAANAANK